MEPEMITGKRETLTRECPRVDKQSTIREKRITKGMCHLLLVISHPNSQYQQLIGFCPEPHEAHNATRPPFLLLRWIRRNSCMLMNDAKNAGTQ